MKRLDVNLKQQVSLPARVREGEIPFLDVISTNKKFIIDEVRKVAPVGRSNYIGVMFHLVKYSDAKNQPRDSQNLGENVCKGECDKMREHKTSTMV